jgi:N-acetylglucosamine kinase
MSVIDMIYGIDIGGTKMEISVFDNHMILIDSWRINTPTQNYKKFIVH